MASKNASNPTPESSLSGLIEIEQAIEAEVAQAEADAARHIEAVREEVSGASQDTEADDAAALRALQDAVARECEEAIRCIDLQATADVERHRRVGEHELDALARWLVAEVAGEAPRE